MLENFLKITVYLVTAVTVNEFGQECLDDISLCDSKIARTTVLIGATLCGAAAAVAVDTLFEEPEAIVETVSEFINQ